MLCSHLKQVWFHNREFRRAVLLWKDPNAVDANNGLIRGFFVWCTGYTKIGTFNFRPCCKRRGWRHKEYVKPTKVQWLLIRVTLAYVDILPAIFARKFPWFFLCLDIPDVLCFSIHYFDKRQNHYWITEKISKLIMHLVCSIVFVHHPIVLIHLLVYLCFILFIAMCVCQKTLPG